MPVSVKKHAALFRKRRSSCLIARPPSRVGANSNIEMPVFAAAQRLPNVGR
jgi:hypothetical protein